MSLVADYGSGSESESEAPPRVEVSGPKQKEKEKEKEQEQVKGKARVEARIEARKDSSQLLYEDAHPDDPIVAVEEVAVEEPAPLRKRTHSLFNPKNFQTISTGKSSVKKFVINLKFGDEQQEDEEEDEEEEARKKMKLMASRSKSLNAGLVSMLPKPKAVVARLGDEEEQKAPASDAMPKVTSFVPYTLKKKQEAEAKEKKEKEAEKKRKGKENEDNDEEEEDDEEDDASNSGSFFPMDFKAPTLDSISPMTAPAPKSVAPTRIAPSEADFPPPPKFLQPGYSQEGPSQYPAPYAPYPPQYPQYPPYAQGSEQWEEEEDEEAFLEDEQFKKILPRSGKGKEEGDIVIQDVDQNKILQRKPGEKYDPTKEAQFQTSFTRGVKKTVNTKEKRKHQITYLAAHAAQIERELNERSATSRLTKKQTQAKYGF